jgi:hypothetical protein
MQISTFIGKTCSIIAGQIIDERKFLYAGSCSRRKSKCVSIQIMFMFYTNTAEDWNEDALNPISNYSTCTVKATSHA